MKNTLLFLFCFSAKMLLAQTDKNLVTTRYVLATVLNMRAKPTKEAKVIAKIPKFSQVEELENLSEVDSIERISIGEFSSEWSKIKYQNKIGYVANYYLGQPININRYATVPIFIIYPYWYQIEPREDGDYLRKIEVKLDTLTDDAYGDERIFIVEKNSNQVEFKILLNESNVKIYEPLTFDIFVINNSPKDFQFDNINNIFCELECLQKKENGKR